MIWHLLADTVLVLHLCFIVFVLLGGFVALRWRWLPWLHLPAIIWASLLEFQGWICPLTPLENWLRHEGGAAGYSGGFIEHYLMPVIYPSGLTPQIQVYLGLLVLLINSIAYALFCWRSPNPSRPEH